ncbi:MAG TPA: ester cyclase [Candidatus Dormibacteraeota bacterium]|nr:ester cyclase [Candidatus Dormibacteraeota bacterium]
MEDNATRFRRLIEVGFGDGDLATLDEVLAQDCVEHQRGLQQGIAGAKGVVQTLHSWFSDFELKVVDLVVDGDKVWTLNRARGVNTGSVMGRPPSGKAVELDVFDVGRFEDGKVVEHWGVPDQLGMLLQVGALHRTEPSRT